MQDLAQDPPSAALPQSSADLLRVPERRMLMAGYTLLCNLAFKVQFHIARAFELFVNHLVHLEPVSMRQVAIIVRLPPSIFRAAPKIVSAAQVHEHQRPVSTFPDAGMTVL